MKTIAPGSLRFVLLAGFVAFTALTPHVFAAGKFKIEEATIAAIQQAILAKQVTATEVVQLYLTRIKAYNGPGVEEPNGMMGVVKMIPHAKGINAFSTLNLRPAALKAWGFDAHHGRSMTDKIDRDSAMPDALETAAALDAAFAKTGKLVGPLHGVVIGIKDQYDTFDMRTTSGADAFYANDRPPRDSNFIKKMRDAGAIIIGKTNLSEYADGTPRSSFGGTFVNAYDTERHPNASSSGSGSAVAANLCTVAIAEETSSSIRGPAVAESCVGIAPTQELVSRIGMIQMGINTRVGPISRTVEDSARVLSVIAGYDPEDPSTAFGVGRLPDKPYESFTHEPSLKGMRIGVVREYMDKALFAKADEQNIDCVNQAIEDLKKLGAEIIDPGEHGELFTAYIRKYYPMLMNTTFTQQNPGMFPVDANGKPVGDQIATLVDLAIDPAKVPGKITLRDIGGRAGAGTAGPAARGGGGAPGESRYFTNLYLRLRGDANIRTQTDLYTKANFYSDPNFQDRKNFLETGDKAMVLDTAARMQRRFAIQQIILAAFADLKLDAVVYPTSTLPPSKLGTPAHPTVNGRPNVWTFLGQQGFPAITVPAGFTTQVYDREADPSLPPPPENEFGGGSGPRVGSREVGPFPAKLPVGVDFLGRPFAEPTLFKIAAAYEKATHHRISPPDFSALPAADGRAAQQ
jgi:Asp-tRNA(Asn)/Glu-tRNA(Gln) amidotransferase A subunit family amidase